MCMPKSDLERDYQFYRENQNRAISVENQTREILRSVGLHPELPGFELFVTAVGIDVLLQYEVEEDIYQMIQRMKIIPTIYPVIKDINPVEQHLKESLRAAGISEDPIECIKKISKKVS